MKSRQLPAMNLDFERTLKVSLPSSVAAQASTAQSKPEVATEPLWRSVRRLASGNHVLAWADQAVVSATSFLALIMIGRWTDPSQLGTYAIGASVLAMLLAAQESLITRPYAIQLYRPLGTPAEFAFSSLLLSCVLSTVAAIVLCAAALALSAFGENRDLAAIAWALAASIPFVLTREFARRFAFAHLRMFRALTVDVAVAALCVILLGWLGWTERLSAVTALGAIGISCAVCSIGWLYLARAEFSFRLADIRATLKQSWVLGKWLFSSQVTLQAQGYMTYWLSMVIAGATITGIYAACMSIISFANPLLYGFFNILTPRSVRALRNEGATGLRRQAVKDSLLLAALMAAFCAIVLIVGEDVMNFLYPSAVYKGNGNVLAVLAFAALAAAIGAPASNALVSAERAQAVAGVTSVSAVLNIVLVWWLMTNWGLLGAAFGVLIAEVVGSLGRWIVFLALVPEINGRRTGNGRDSEATKPGVTSTQTTSHLKQPDSLKALTDDIGLCSGPGRILSGVFETLDRVGIPYCVLHGYETYPQQIRSDVDCVIDSKMTPAQLLALFHYNSQRIGAEVVRCRGYHILLAGKNTNGSPCFLTLDMSVDYELNDLPFYVGTEILESRQRYRQFWIPAASIEFGCYLVRTIAKGRLDDERARRLSYLYQQDATRCAQQVARFWGVRNTELILLAAKSGDWQPVRQRLGDLQVELRMRAIFRRPGHILRRKLHNLLDRIGRVWRLDGLNVVLLGPDGAGKSSVIDVVGTMLLSAFPRSTCWGFAPSLRRLLRRRAGPTDQPHALPPRSFATSVIRAAYWFVYYTLGYVNLHLALARSTLVLNDRHFVDILVDARRYRYGGPLWLTRLIWQLIPKPDLIILLDAPPEVLRARKQEISYEEIARQRGVYLSMVRTMQNGRVVDASQSFEHVAGQVSDIILQHLAMRIARRFGLQQNESCRTYQSTFAEVRHAITPITKEN